MFNKSDEVIVEEWKQNPYYQYFTGEIYFAWTLPCDASDLVYFRKRIGEAGVAKIFSSSLELHQDKIAQAEAVITDTTVQEKNITFPTDDKLRLKAIDKLRKIAKERGLKLKQTFSKEIKSLKLALRFSHHPKRKKAARKARKRLKTIAGILLREVKKNLAGKTNEQEAEFLKIAQQVIYQERHSKDKIYSIHEPQTACIAKGKSHKPYEFGAKISFSILAGSCVVVDVSHFAGNPHDSKTLETVMPKLKQILPEACRYNIVDRGYRGKTKMEGKEILIPNPAKDSQKGAAYQEWKRKKCRQRAGIEPVIGHLKSDHRMLRNYLKGTLGDKINALLAATAFNFKKALNEIKHRLIFLLHIFHQNIKQKEVKMILYF
jgi:IS5 family transposase